MTDVPAFHAQRDRAESFGAIAESYDRFRPGYPDALVDALIALQPSAVLDIGCGTGKAARLLIDRGLDVVGVEPDPDMAAVARRHGVEVEVAPFEQWDARGRTFDLIVSGQAWHWVDPAVGTPKLVQLLRPGGTICLFWNYEDLSPGAKQVVDEVYRRLAPQLIDPDRAADDDGSHLNTLRRTGCFAALRAEKFPWAADLTVDAWIGRISTYSNHVLLGAERLAELQQALRAALGGPAATVQLAAGTYTVWAQP